MLQVHYQLVNTQIELGQAFALLYRLRHLIGSMPLTLDVPTTTATHVVLGPPVMIHDPCSSVQTQYVANLRTLIDSFVNTASRPPARAEDVVDLTV